MRGQLLKLLFEARVTPSGWTSGVALGDAVDRTMPPGQQFESETDCIGMWRNLHISGFSDERMTPPRCDDKFGLHYLEYRITAAGLALILDSAPPNPLIDDDRIAP